MEPHSSLWTVGHVLCVLRGLTRRERDSSPMKPLRPRGGLGLGRGNVQLGLFQVKQAGRHLIAGAVSGDFCPGLGNLFLRGPGLRLRFPIYCVPTEDQDQWEEVGRPGWGNNGDPGGGPHLWPQGPV